MATGSGRRATKPLQRAAKPVSRSASPPLAAGLMRPPILLRSAGISVSEAPIVNSTESAAAIAGP